MVDMSDPAHYQQVLASRPEPLPTGLAGSEAEAEAGEPVTLIRVEVEPDPTFRGDVGPADLIERFTDRVDELGAAVAVVAQRLSRALEDRFTNDRSSRWQMAEVGMEFGINLEAESGIVVAKAKTAAAFKVSIMWAKRDDDTPSQS